MRIMAIVAALAAAGAAHAQEAMGTAGASGTPPASEAARQIDDWIASSPAAREREESVLSQLSGPADGKIHGEVGLAIGTDGYRSGYITSVVPIGESGSLMLSYGQERGRGLHYGYDGFGRLRTEPMLTPPMW